MTKDEALKLSLEALETELSIDWANNDEFNASAEKMYEAIVAIKEALAQPEQEQNLKLMPREATPEMLKAMDECSTEGYDERLYAGHAGSVYMAAWDAFQSTEESQQERSGNCPLEDCDGGPKSHGCWAHNCEWKPNKTQKQEPVALQMDVIVVNLVREGINKHRARELAEHFIKHITPPQPEQELVALPDWFNHAFPSGALEAVGFHMPTPRAFAEELYRRWKRRFEELSTPPQRKPLTLEQLREHWQVAKVLDMTDAEIDFADYVLITQDVEALHGIKENT